MSIQGVFSTVSPYFQYRNDKTRLVNEETLYFEYFLKNRSRYIFSQNIYTTAVQTRMLLLNNE